MTAISLNRIPGFEDGESESACVAEEGFGAGIRELRRQVVDDYYLPASRQLETPWEKFARLAAEWKQATKFMSSVTGMSTHWAYQQIIGMGAEALPLLLQDLEQEPDHWFWALHAITGVDPVPSSEAGDVSRMTDAWLRWGRERGPLG